MCWRFISPECGSICATDKKLDETPLNPIHDQGCDGLITKLWSDAQTKQMGFWHQGRENRWNQKQAIATPMNELTTSNPSTEEISGEEMQRLMNLSSELFCIKGPSGYCEKVSQNWEQHLGWTAQEMRSRPWSDFIHPEDIRTTRILEQNCQAGKTYQIENRFSHKNGLYRWLSWKISCNQDGYIYAVARDITAQERLKRQFNSLQEHLNAFFTAAPAGLAILDTTLRFVQINETLADIHGVSATAHIGKTYREILPQIAPRIEPLLREMLEKGTPVCKTEFSREMLNSRGKPQYWVASFFPIQDQINRVRGIGMMVVEVTQLKQTEASLRHSEAINKAILKAIPDAIFSHCPEGTYLDYIPAQNFETLVPPREFLGKKVTDVLPTELAGQVMQSIEQAMSAEAPQCFEYQLEINNQSHYFEARTVKRDEFHLISIVRDVSDRIRAEKALRESEEIHRITLQNISDAVFISNDRGELTYVCSNVDIIFGWEFEEVQKFTCINDFLGEGFFEWLHESGDIGNPNFDRLSNLEWQIRDKKGNRHHLLVNVKRVAIKKGTLLYTCRDITDRKQAEKALQDSEERFRTIFERGPLGMAIADLNYQLIKVNPMFCQMLDAREADLVGKPISALSHPDDIAADWQPLQQLFTREIPYFKIEKPYVTQSKQTLWIELTVCAIWNRKGQPIYALAMLENMTPRQQAIEARKRSERHYQLLLEQASDGILVFDDRGYLAEVNSRGCELLGMSREELLQKKIGQLISAADLVTDSLPLAELKRGIPILVEGHRNRADGTCLPIEVSAKKVEDGRIQAIVRDISDRKRTEETILRIAKAVESASDAIAIADTTHTYIYQNPAFRHLFKYTLEELNAAGGLQVAIADSDKATTAIETLKSGQSWHGKVEIRTRGGAIIPTWLQVDAIADGGGNIVGTLAIFRDITPLKRSEEALRQSKETAWALLNATTESLLLIDPSGIVLAANQTAAKRLGKSVDELMGKCVYDSLPPSVAASRRLHVERVVETGKPARFEDSRYGRYFDSYLYPIFDRLGNVARLAIFEHEISDRIRAENELRQSEARFRKIFEEARLGMALIGESGEFLKVNSMLCHMLGYCESELNATTVAQITHPDDVETQRQLSRLIFAGEIPSYTIQKRYVKKNGETLWAILRACLLRDASGKPPYALVTIEDVTWRKHIEAEMCQLNAMLEQRVQERTAALQAANQELEAFCYSVSHDLRAPLRIINGFSQALLEDYDSALDELGKDYLHRVCAGTQKMGQLIDALLSLSRVSRTQMQRKRVNLAEIARSILAEKQQSDGDRCVGVEIPSEIVAEGDPHLLQVLLDNLLGNAWKFTSKTPNARITFGVTDPSSLPDFILERLLQNQEFESATLPIYFVGDNGAGFDMTYTDKLFTPFQRLHKSSDFEGTGIGLATVARIVHRHGGEVCANSQVGGGSTFYFTLQPPQVSSAKKP